MSVIQQAVAWVKRNKVAAASVGAGGAFLVLSKKGQDGGGGGGGDTGEPISGEENAGGYVQLVPVSAPPSEGAGLAGEADTGQWDEAPYAPETPYAPEAPYAPEPASPADPAPAAPAPDSTPDSSPAPSQAAHGVTVAGHFFAGASSATQVGTGRQPSGNYAVYLVKFPGRTEYWWRYTTGSKAGAWTGPHSKPGSGSPSGGSAPSPSPTSGAAPAPAPAPAKPKSCADLFPNYPHHNANNGAPSPKSCYKNTCEKGKRVHVYKDGDRQGTSTKC